MIQNISLAWLNKDPYFLNIFEKLSIEEKLENIEYSYILACAILFIKEYSKDNRKTKNFEIGYFIILKYTKASKDYEPLFDLSINLGLYPISKHILKNNLIPTDSIHSFSIDTQLDRFKHKDIIETLEQNKFRKEIVDSEEEDNCYIAPTSFGKSSLIIEVIKNSHPNKTAIIVPTKSLLTQTYRLVSESFPDRKVIFHDEMYSNEDRFIAVFTQERALRLLKEETINFDTLIIDEAHNLFDSSSRSILLSRVIRLNKKKNNSHKVFYFSPLISDSKNLKVDKSQDIFERKINLNLKEPDIHEHRLDGNNYIYNKFLDVFFRTGKSTSFIDYINTNLKRKNFVYLMAPKKVEELAFNICNKLNNIENRDLKDLSDIISSNVHDEFYCVDYVRKGLLYLHGKLPDLVKEYLESKFREIEDLNILVANSVILEGVNLPIDNLYILNTHRLKGKELTNLIGRVNRLNEVFNSKDKSLDKLIPNIHFINTEYFNKKNSNMSNKIKLLKSSIFKDEIKNPTLLSYDFEKQENFIENTTNSDSKVQAENQLNNAINIKDREDFLVSTYLQDEHKLKSSFIESGLYAKYYEPDNVIKNIEEKAIRKRNDNNWSNLDILSKVASIFIEDIEEQIIDQTFLRLKNKSARDFYLLFSQQLHTLSLKEHINSITAYFHSIKEQRTGREFYIGTSYGEFARESDSNGRKAYIDLNSKSNKELVNIALVKIKMESDFLSFTLNPYITTLQELSLISEDEYNQFIYGTTKKKNTDFTKLGLSGSIIYKLEKDKQLQNINFDELGHVTVNNDFKSYLARQDDLVNFEIRKYININ